MRKKLQPTWLSEHLQGVFLFRDDVEAILDLMETRGLSVLLSDSDYEYDSLDELIKNRGLRPREIKITGTGGEKGYRRIQVSVDQNKVFLTADNEFESVWYALKEMLRGRIPWLYKWTNPFWWFMSIFCFLSVVALLTEKASGGTNYIRVPVWIPIILAILIIVWLTSLLYRNQVRLPLLRRRDEGGFWRRNAERIALMAIGTSLGLLLQVIYRLLSSG